MNERKIYKIVTHLIAIVWLSNGLFCKVLNLVPRHEQIVGRILNLEGSSAQIFTILIGISEIVMTIWILSGFKRRINAISQIIIVATMNMIEFILVPDLLLWGKLNSIFASLFILVIYYNEFILNPRKNSRDIKCFHF